ncbi:PD-(D/E)XK nuclease family protein [Natronobiforma cellulositropha]|uniref:hypothetical protein n=1 Tax=Natronobiforma cellulositropha TaxID=1679076 RepID=UPI0021D57BE8|nr:hypothetical protein [Natronobiforma cellulositropha]
MSSPALEGVLTVLPTPRADLLTVVADEYAALAGEYGPENVLVCKRHPAGVECVRRTIADTDPVDGTPLAPRVESLPEHASKVLEEYDPTLERLEYEERIELISLVIAGAKREIPPYLERARDHDTFARDVGQVLLEATRQRIRHEDAADAHECLAFLYAMNDRFHEVLTERGFVERADVIPRVVSLLESDADGLRTRVSDSFDAVLALEFEEFRALDRRYLAALTADPETALVCLGERHASVERTRVEPGRLEDVADGLEIDHLETGADAEHRPPHASITQFLATGTAPDTAGTARCIHTQTARDGVRAVAAEIETVLERSDWTHDDIAVAVPSVERVPETRKGLRNAGVPTATVGTNTLAEDPAVNELYAVVSAHCGREHDLVTERLAARVPDFSPALLEATADRSITRSLERWIVETDLKGRIATEESWIDAAEQYESVRRVLEIARFVEETDLVAPDWEGLARMLRRTIKYDAPYVHDVETRSPTGGVTVCGVDALKFDSREVVFVLDLTDGNYPGEHHLTPLFPRAWLTGMPAFPAVTDPSWETVSRTFAPAPDPADATGDPFDAYHAQRSRRALALATRAARSHLYFCTYERETGGLRRTCERSRYLSALESRPEVTLESVTPRATTGALSGRTNALEALLDEPWGELERILREASTGGETDLAETEALFAEIEHTLESVDDDLVAAVHSQFEFAAGEVSRRE